MDDVRCEPSTSETWLQARTSTRTRIASAPTAARPVWLNMVIFLSPRGLRPVRKMARTATVPHTQHAVANLSMMVLRDNRRFGNPALHPAHDYRPMGTRRGFDPRSARAGRAGQGRAGNRRNSGWRRQAGTVPDIAREGRQSRLHRRLKAGSRDRRSGCVAHDRAGFLAVERRWYRGFAKALDPIKYKVIHGVAESAREERERFRDRGGVRGAGQGGSGQARVEDPNGRGVATLYCNLLACRAERSTCDKGAWQAGAHPTPVSIAQPLSAPTQVPRNTGTSADRARCRSVVPVSDRDGRRLDIGSGRCLDLTVGCSRSGTA